jgi:hypothetical protein
MAKISTKFYTYLFIVMIGLAVMFPLTQATYEGFKEGFGKKGNQWKKWQKMETTVKKK